MTTTLILPSQATHTFHLSQKLEEQHFSQSSSYLKLHKLKQNLYEIYLGTFTK